MGSSPGYSLRDWLVRKLPKGATLLDRDVASYFSQNLRLPADQRRYQDSLPVVAARLVAMLPRVHHLQDLGLRTAKAEETAVCLEVEVRAALARQDEKIDQLVGALDTARRAREDFESGSYAEALSKLDMSEAALTAEVARGKEAAKTISVLRKKLVEQGLKMREEAVEHRKEVERLREEKPHDNKELGPMLNYVVTDIKRYTLNNAEVDDDFFSGHDVRAAAQRGVELFRQQYGSRPRGRTDSAGTSSAASSAVGETSTSGPAPSAESPPAIPLPPPVTGSTESGVDPSES